MSPGTSTVAMIHPGGLGDVLLAVPAMVRLRNRFPQHRLLLCTGDQIAQLLIDCRVIDAHISMPGSACVDLFSGPGSVTDETWTWLSDCELAIGWTQDRYRELFATLKLAGVCKAIVKSPFSTDIRAIHQRDRFLEAIDEPSLNDEEGVLLTVTERLHFLGQSSLQRLGLSPEEAFAIVHPGSGSVHKCVPSETLASVVSVIQAFGATPVILEGPADHEPVESLLRFCTNPPKVLKGVDLLTVAGVLAQAQLFVGQDSGITHLAGLIGVRTIALFGPTDPGRWAPKGVHVTVLQGQPCLCPSWDEVSQCEKKSCLEFSQDELRTHCLAHLKISAIR